MTENCKEDRVSYIKILLQHVGTHSAFRETISDYETKREKSIHDAESFMKYQIAFIDAFYDQDLNALEDEYEVCCDGRVSQVLLFAYIHNIE